MGMKESGIIALIYLAIFWLIRFSTSWIPPLFALIGRVLASVIVWVHGFVMHHILKRPLIVDEEVEIADEDSDGRH